MSTRTTFNVGWLYPDLMNIYGDRGNILTLLKRAEWHGLEPQLTQIERGPATNLDGVDLFFFGGGQDREQSLIYDDLKEHKQHALEDAHQAGAQILAVCGGYQLLGHYYVTADGEKLNGIGLLDATTQAGKKRAIGDVVVESNADLKLTPRTLVGFENHSGRTFLGAKAKPLGKVLTGSGNNGDDRSEGVVQENIIGTYLHGSLLPKNPHLADYLIRKALIRRGVDAADLRPLDDEAEMAAHAQILRRAQRR